MIGARDGHGSGSDKVKAIRVPDLAGELGGVIRKGLGYGLTAGDEDLTIREHDGVVKGAWIPHIVDPGHGGVSVGGTQGDNMSINGGLAGGLIIRSSPEGQDLAIDGIVHDGVPIHRIPVGSAVPGPSGAAGTAGAIPVDGFAGPSLKDGTVFPREQPAMVVGAKHALSVGRQHGRDGAAGQRIPGVGVGAVQFTVLVPLATAPGATNDKGPAVGDGALRLVTPAFEHVGGADPAVRAGVIEAGLGIVVAAGGKGTTVPIDRQAFAKHVVPSVGHGPLGHDLGDGIVRGSLRQAARAPAKGSIGPRGPT